MCWQICVAAHYSRRPGSIVARSASARLESSLYVQLLAVLSTHCSIRARRLPRTRGSLPSKWRRPWLASHQAVAGCDRAALGLESGRTQSVERILTNRAHDRPPPRHDKMFRKLLITLAVLGLVALLLMVLSDDSADHTAAQQAKSSTPSRDDTTEDVVSATPRRGASSSPAGKKAGPAHERAVVSVPDRASLLKRGTEGWPEEPAAPRAPQQPPPALTETWPYPPPPKGTPKSVSERPAPQGTEDWPAEPNGRETVVRPHSPEFATESWSEPTEPVD